MCHFLYYSYYQWVRMATFCKAFFHSKTDGGMPSFFSECQKQLGETVVKLSMLKHDHENRSLRKVYHRIYKFSQETHWQAATGLTLLCFVHFTNHKHFTNSAVHSNCKANSPALCCCSVCFCCCWRLCCLLYISGYFLLPIYFIWKMSCRLSYANLW